MSGAREIGNAIGHTASNLLVAEVAITGRLLLLLERKGILERDEIDALTDELLSFEGEEGDGADLQRLLFQALKKFMDDSPPAAGS